MGLFDILGFGAEKLYGKYKSSKMESAMDSLLDSLDTCSVSLEVFPYVDGEDSHTIKGRIYRTTKDKSSNSTAPYFLTTNKWLKKSGVDIDDDKAYQAAFGEKGGYMTLKLSKTYPTISKNYSELYNTTKVMLSLHIYLDESKTMLSIPKFVLDKNGKAALSKKASTFDFSQLEKLSKEDSSSNGDKFKNFYSRAKVFGYLVAEELNGYNIDNLDDAFSQFEAKHGKDAEIAYTF